jgi:hypothetical protein
VNSLTPSNSTINLGQGEVFNAVISGGTGPFTANLVASNGIVVNTITGVSAGVITFGPIIPQNSTDTYNVIATDLGTSSACTFTSTSNTITVVEIGSTTPQQPSNGGSPGGTSGGIPSSGSGAITVTTAYTNSTTNQTGYRILNFTQDGVQRFKIDGEQFNVTLNFISPNDVGITVNGKSYTLSDGQTTELNDPQGYAYYAKLMSISYLPILHESNLEVYEAFLKPKNITTTVPTPTTVSTSSTSTVTTTVHQRATSNVSGAASQIPPVRRATPPSQNNGYIALSGAVIGIVAIGTLYYTTKRRNKDIEKGENKDLASSQVQPEPHHQSSTVDQKQEKD